LERRPCPEVSELLRKREGAEMNRSDQGIARGGTRGEENPTDKQRAQTAHESKPDKSATREETRDPKLEKAQKARDSE
jgi:hypothetical protein